MMIRVPADVRRRHQIPAGDLHLVSAWPMAGGDQRGLWVTLDDDDSGRIYAITGVPHEQVTAWTDEA